MKMAQQNRNISAIPWNQLGQEGSVMKSNLDETSKPLSDRTLFKIVFECFYFDSTKFLM